MQRSGIDTIKYHIWSRISMGQVFLGFLKQGQILKMPPTAKFDGISRVNVNICCGSHWKHLTETLQMSTHNIWYWWVTKNSNLLTPFYLGLLKWLYLLHVRARFCRKALTLCKLGNFSCIYCHLLLSKLIFSKNSFSNTIPVSNNLDPDQDRHTVGPDLCPNCLQRLSADNKSPH